MEKEEKDIRFVARFYRENRLDTTQAWQKLGIGKQKNNSILLYRLITIAAVTFLIAGFSWWWIYGQARLDCHCLIRTRRQRSHASGQQPYYAGREFGLTV